MKAQNAVVGVVALVAGTALGYLIKPSAEVPVPTEASTPVVKKAASSADEAELKALRRQVKALQARLAAQTEARGGEDAKAAETAVEERGERRRGRGRPGDDMRANFEQWKKDNPEEFAKMEKRRQEFMQRRAERAKSRQDFLASIDTSKMSAGEKETHEKLQGLLAKREELEGRMAQMMELSDEERGQLFEEMRETHHAIAEINGQEREALFKQTAEALGFAGEDVGAITQTLTEIIDATDNGFGGGRGPGGPGGPGGFGGGRGGRGGR